MVRLNVRLLAILLLVVALFAGGVWYLHYLQTDRIAAAFLAQAEQAAKGADLVGQAGFLERYLDLAPTDLKQRTRLGQLQAQIPGEGAAAYLNIDRVLSKDPDNPELLELAADLAMRPRIAQYGRAQDYLKKLLDADPNNARFLYKKGKLTEAQGGGTDDAAALAADWYLQAIRASPTFLDAYVSLADLLVQHPRIRPRATGGAYAAAAVLQAAPWPGLVMSVVAPDSLSLRVENVLDSMVAYNPAKPQARLARWRFHVQQDPDLADHRRRLDAAGEDVRRAAQMAPDDLNVLLEAAHLAILQKDYPQAQHHAQRARELVPSDGRVYLMSAGAEPEATRQIDWLRQGLKRVAPADPARPQIAWALTMKYLDGRQFADAEAIAKAMRSAATAAGDSDRRDRADFLQARIHLAKGEWSQAAQLFETVRPSLGRQPHFGAEIDRALFDCYAHLEDPTRQAAALQRASQEESSSPSARLALAAAQAASGRLDEAILAYREAVALPGAPEAARIDLARLLFLREAQKAKPDWTEVETAVAQLEKSPATAGAATLLRAELLAAKNDFTSARRLVAEAKDRQPKPDRLRFWQELSSLALRQGRPDEARQVLDDAVKEQGDSVDLRLARADYWLTQPPQEAGKALTALADDADRFSPDERARLFQGLGTALNQAGAPRDAIRMGLRLGELPAFQNDLRVRLSVLDLALSAGDRQAAEQAVAEIRRIEGNEGPAARFAEAQVLLAAGRRGEPADLGRVRSLLELASAARGSWPAVHVATAELEELQGNWDAAIDRYRRAIRLGDRSPRVQQLLVRALCQVQNYDEAEQGIRELQAKRALPTSMKRLAADVALRMGDGDRALTLAREAVPDADPNFQDHLWLAQILQAAHRPPAEIEDCLRRAVDRANQNPEPWSALIRFLQTRGSKDQAEVALREARSRLQGCPKLLLGRFYETVGQPELARKYFDDALQAAPTEWPVVRNVADYYTRISRLDLAEPLLASLAEGRVPAPPSEAASARRALALVLAQTGDYARFGRALALVGLRLNPETSEVDEESPAGDVPEQKARIQVLAAHRLLRGPRRAAIAMLEAQQDKRALDAAERFLLAQLYEANGQWNQARGIFSVLATAPGAGPGPQAYYARALLRHNEPGDAELWVERLEEAERTQHLAPNALGAVELRADLLHAQGDHAKALALIKTYVERQGAPPQDQLLLARHEARAGRLSDAMTDCDRAWKSCPPEPVAETLTIVLREAKATPGQFAQGLGAISAAAQKDPTALFLWLALGDLAVAAERYDEAATAYRHALDLQPDNAVTLNNLAWLEALVMNKPEQALARINRAIDKSGPGPDLLDTRGSVYLALARYDQAVSDFREAAADGTSPNRLLNLARALYAAGDVQGARTELARAQQAHLTIDQLPPIERPAGRKLIEALTSR